MKKWIIRIVIGVVSAAFIFGFGYVAFFSMPGDLDTFEKAIGGKLIRSNFKHRVSSDLPFRRGRFEVSRTFLVDSPISQVRNDLKSSLASDLYKIRVDRVGEEHERLVAQLWPNEGGINRSRAGFISMYPGRAPNNGARNRPESYLEKDKRTTVFIVRSQFDADPIAFAIDHFQRLYEGANKSLNPPKPPAKTTTVTIEK